MQTITNILERLCEDKNALHQKISYAVKNLEKFKVIQNGIKTRIFSKYLIKFGNLGQVRYNYALYESIKAKCSYDMIAIVSFLMYGIPAVKKMTEKAGLDPVSGKQ